MATNYKEVENQFDQVAQAYLTSKVHAQGEDLEYVTQFVKAGDAVLDVGCGAGHLSFALAPKVTSIVALDLSDGMLDTVQQEAQRKGLQNLTVKKGVAETLPFKAGTFDVVCTRLSAHHWANVPAALLEMRRVLKPKGRVIIIDVVGYADPLVDTHLQSIELVRDPSHVRDYTTAEWNGFLKTAGFNIESEKEWRIVIEFNAWVERMRSTPPQVEVIRHLFANAPAIVKKQMQIGQDHSFYLDVHCFTGLMDD